MSIRPADLSIRPKVLIIKKECVKVKMEKGNDVVMRNTAFTFESCKKYTIQCRHARATLST